MNVVQVVQLDIGKMIVLTSVGHAIKVAKHVAETLWLVSHVGLLEGLICLKKGLPVSKYVQPVLMAEHLITCVLIVSMDVPVVMVLPWQIASLVESLTTPQLTITRLLTKLSVWRHPVLTANSYPLGLVTNAISVPPNARPVREKLITAPLLKAVPTISISSTIPTTVCLNARMDFTTMTQPDSVRAVRVGAQSVMAPASLSAPNARSTLFLQLMFPTIRSWISTSAQLIVHQDIMKRILALFALPVISHAWLAKHQSQTAPLVGMLLEELITMTTMMRICASHNVRMVSMGIQTTTFAKPVMITVLAVSDPLILNATNASKTTR